MIYELDNVYYLKSGNVYEKANIEIKHNYVRNKNVIVISGSNTYQSFSEEDEQKMNIYLFKELEKRILERIDV